MWGHSKISIQLSLLWEEPACMCLLVMMLLYEWLANSCSLIRTSANCHSRNVLTLECQGECCPLLVTLNFDTQEVDALIQPVDTGIILAYELHFSLQMLLIWSVKLEYVNKLQTSDKLLLVQVFVENVIEQMLCYLQRPNARPVEEWRRGNLGRRKGGKLWC